MDVGIIVNIVLSILSFALAAISVITVIITLRQNNKMLEANSRPYIVAYLVYEEFHNCVYLCVKNFGTTSAIINSLQITPEINLCEKSSNEVLNDTMIAPNQQVHFLILDETKQGQFQRETYAGTVSITYTDCCTSKQHQETYKITTEYTNEIMSLRSSNSSMNNLDNSIRNIENILEYMKNSNM
ncbi:MAG: hypothetical protein IKU25_07530 [Clostridia bacterium]|nr:hypothetical protein [Clostridia bacterium]